MAVFNRKLISLVLFPCMLTPLTSNAIGFACDNCTMDDAIQIAESVQSGDVTVYDFSSRYVWQFSVTRNSEGEALAKPITPSSTLLQTFNQYFDIRQSNGSSSKSAWDINAAEWGMTVNGVTRPISAYDVVTNSAVRNYIGDRLRSTGASPFGQFADNVVRNVNDLLGGVLNSSDMFTTDYQLVFKDGSKVTFSLTLKSTNNTPSYSPGTARTPNGANIVDAPVTANNAQNHTGEFTFRGTDDMQRFIDAARLYGVRFTGSGGGKLSCTWDGQTLTCKILMV